MENIYYLLAIALVFAYFIYLRKVAEIARSQIKRYCQQENLQLIAIARVSSRLKFHRKYGPHLLSVFNFDFSGDGQSSNQGELVLRGQRLESIHVPAYKIN